VCTDLLIGSKYTYNTPVSLVHNAAVRRAVPYSKLVRSENLLQSAAEIDEGVDVGHLKHAALLAIEHVQSA
jgi:hypothetical protein